MQGVIDAAEHLLHCARRRAAHLSDARRGVALGHEPKHGELSLRQGRERTRLIHLALHALHLVSEGTLDGLHKQISIGDGLLADESACWGEVGFGVAGRPKVGEFREQQERYSRVLVTEDVGEIDAVGTSAEIQVDHRGVGIECSDLASGLRRARRGADLETRPPERRADEARGEPLVLDHEHASGLHRAKVPLGRWPG